MIQRVDQNEDELQPENAIDQVFSRGSYYCLIENLKFSNSLDSPNNLLVFQQKKRGIKAADLPKYLFIYKQSLISKTQWREIESGEPTIEPQKPVIVIKGQSVTTGRETV